MKDKNGFNEGHSLAYRLT